VRWCYVFGSRWTRDDFEGLSSVAVAPAAAFFDLVMDGVRQGVVALVPVGAVDGARPIGDGRAAVLCVQRRGGALVEEGHAFSDWPAFWRECVAPCLVPASRAQFAVDAGVACQCCSRPLLWDVDISPPRSRAERRARAVRH